MVTIDELRAKHPKYKADTEKWIEVQSICEKCKTQTYYPPGKEHYHGCTGMLLPLGESNANNIKSPSDSQ